MAIAVENFERTNRETVRFFETLWVPERSFGAKLQDDFPIDLAGSAEFGQHLIGVGAGRLAQHLERVEPIDKIIETELRDDIQMVIHREGETPIDRSPETLEANRKLLAGEAEAAEAAAQAMRLAETVSELQVRGV